MSARRVAILGFGFSGLMVAANLVREAASGTTLYIIAEDLRGLGVAYATTNPSHLLNVTADRMSAFADAPEHLLLWLATPAAKAAKQSLGLSADYGASSFIPRALYGQYLQSIWQETQTLAEQKHLHIKLVEATATRIVPGQPLSILTARGDAIAVDAAVLATGHADKPLLAHLPAQVMMQNPWATGALDAARHWDAPVMLLGTGLTAVDTLLSLRDAGYLGPVVAVSRNGRLPAAHVLNQSPFAFDMNALLAANSPAALLQLLRSNVRIHAAWRPVVEALRPHTSLLWQRWNTLQQKRFLARLMPFWNVHRHRMAPEIHARITDEIARGGLRVIASRRMDAVMEEGACLVRITARDGTAETLTPSRIIHCAGQEMNLARNPSTLIKQALADHVMEPHGNGVGLAADPAQRVWGTCYPNLYAVGSLLTGQLLESTAVPELRAQAASVAAAIVNQ